MKSVARKCLEMASLFEAELLVRLMLRTWQHPFADDVDFADALLENAAEALREASRGQRFIEGLPAKSMNLIAAVWYVEYCNAEQEPDELHVIEARKSWLLAVRRALPSCFCDPSDLPPS